MMIIECVFTSLFCVVDNSFPFLSCSKTWLRMCLNPGRNYALGAKQTRNKLARGSPTEISRTGLSSPIASFFWSTDVPRPLAINLANLYAGVQNSSTTSGRQLLVMYLPSDLHMRSCKGVLCSQHSL